jgi:hypothetical protein
MVKTLRQKQEEYEVMLKAFKTALRDVNKEQLEYQKTMKEANKITSKNKKELREVVENTEGITKRTKILNTVLKMNNDQLNLGAKTLSDFRKAGGTTFEYLATFMKSAKEEVRLFGMEAASARRIMYGFMPRGAFRLINQLATSFDAVGAAMRGIRDGGEGADSMLTTFLKVTKKLPSFDNTFGKVFSMASSKGGGYFAGKQMLQTQSQYARRTGGAGNTDRFGGLFDQSTFDAAKKNISIKDRLSILKKEAKQRRKERMDSIKAFFKSPKWKEVGKTMSFLGKGVVQNLAKFLFMAMLYMVLITVAIAALRKPIQKGLEFVFEIFKAAWPLISEGFSDIFDGIVGIYQSLISGDILGIIEGFWTIAWGVIQVAFGIFSALLVGIITFVIGVVLGILEKAKDFIVDFLNFKGTVKDNLKRIIIIGVAVLAFIYGFPVIIAAVAITAFVVLAKMIGKAIKNALGFKATGGIVTNDMTVVGERGPELVSLPRGSRVHSNSESRRMTGGVVNNYNITINAKDTSKAEMRRIADEIGRMVSSKINRRTSNRSSM